MDGELGGGVGFGILVFFLLLRGGLMGWLGRRWHFIVFLLLLFFVHESMSVRTGQAL